MLEISKEDGLPVLKLIVEIELMSNGITPKLKGKIVTFYNPTVNEPTEIFKKEGANDYIVKPFSGKKLLERIKEILERKNPDYQKN